MLQVQDWLLVGIGGVFVIFGLALRLTSRGKAELAKTASKHRFGGPIRWMYPLISGLCLLFGQLPRLLGAPYVVVGVFDAMGLSLAIALFVLVIRQLRPRERRRNWDQA
ncbi:hypothetical protein ACFVW1_37745 [Streptomyces olivochromogenes]|uniref:hypothetical protein n=1 Tax=Streptomyces olivochromogenes TaxID=1963 RepID=UPI0036DA76C8